MAELRPYPLAALVRRALGELAAEGKVFDLPRAKFFGGTGRDLGVRFHGHVGATPLGPAAGPHSQMAQNIVLSWLAGCRVIELKTVQVLDELEIARPCIDMQTVGFNVEWSQELKLEESLEEYVKASMAIDILRASGVLELADGEGDVVFDMSVGYDLEGIQGARVDAFIDGMKDASAVVERLRGELGGDLARFRDLDFRTRLSDTLTLSTFHGCPPDEIERIVEHLLERKQLHSIVKLNPTLLGPEETRRLLNEELGYELKIPDEAFEKDAKWSQMVGFVERLGELADSLELGFGVKFTNTLIVENERDFFPESEKTMYLSGRPLHVLAMHLVQRFRETFGDRFGVSFSAGVDGGNFADSVSLGLVPVTVCSDFLQPGGYGRARSYFRALEDAMERVGARSIDEFVVRARGLGASVLRGLEGISEELIGGCIAALEAGGDLREVAGDEIFSRWVGAVAVANTNEYVSGLASDVRYHASKNSKVPKKIGVALELFDCTTCDKCVPVCPNDANFSFVLPRLEQEIVKLNGADGAFSVRVDGTLVIEKKRQYGTFADFCNLCGNCDVFCPEDGGPYMVKPLFFGTLADWQLFKDSDGFAVENGAGDGGTKRLWGRIGGCEFSYRASGGRVEYTGTGFSLELDPENPSAARGTADGEVDLTYLFILRWVHDAVYHGEQINYLNTLNA